MIPDDEMVGDTAEYQRGTYVPTQHQPGGEAGQEVRNRVHHAGSKVVAQPDTQVVGGVLQT